MIKESGPQSLDELEAIFKDHKRAKIQRIMEHFRSAGFLEKVPRYDRLPYLIWNMLQTQYLRRGNEWLLQKGGLIRQLGEKEANKFVNKIGTKSFNISDVEEILGKISNEESMLLSESEKEDLINALQSDVDDLQKTSDKIATIKQKSIGRMDN